MLDTTEVSVEQHTEDQVSEDGQTAIADRTTALTTDITDEVCKEQPKQPNEDVPLERYVDVHRDITKDVYYNLKSHDVCNEPFEDIPKVVKHDNDREADQEGYTSAKVTEGAGKNISNKWTASRPVTPDYSETATKWELNSTIMEGPKQDLMLLQDKNTTKPGNENNTALVLGTVQPKINEPENFKEDAGTNTVLTVPVEKPAHYHPFPITNMNVPINLPIKPMKSDKLKQEAFNKFYGMPAVAATKFGFPVDDTVYSAQQIHGMLRRANEDRMDDIEEENLRAS